jgi:hypothetical protein
MRSSSCGRDTSRCSRRAATASPDRPRTRGRSPRPAGEADGGTLFLDEVGELLAELPAHLLRVLDAHGSARRTCAARTCGRDAAALKHDLLARFSARVELPPPDAGRSSEIVSPFAARASGAVKR